MTREESAKWAALLQAQADGKQLEFEIGANNWTAFDLCGWHVDQHSPDRWRIASDLPPKPSQEWMDKHAVDIISAPMQWHYAQDNHPNAIVCWLHPDEEKWLIPNCVIGECGKSYADATTYIVRRRAPEVKPWTIDTVPMPLVLKRKYDSTLWVVVSARTDGVLTCGTHDDSLGFNTQANASIMRHSWKWLMDKFTHRDGSPCGEVSK